MASGRRLALVYSVLCRPSLGTQVIGLVCKCFTCPDAWFFASNSHSMLAISICNVKPLFPVSNGKEP